MTDQHHKVQDFKDFLLEELTISNFEGKEWSLASIRGPLYIFEDIFGGPVSGSVDIYDAMDLPHLLPFIGEERIHIKLAKPLPVENESDSDVSESYDKIFRVYHISDRRNIKKNFQAYTIHFVSEEYFRNFHQVVQRGFVDMTYSEMVEEVYSELVEQDRPLVVEPTKHKHNFLAGNMNPFQFFNCLASRSVSDEENGATYVFYEDREQFNFVTVSKLMQQEPSKTYIHQPTNLTLPQDDRPWDTEREFVNVETYYHTSNINPLDNMRFGMYGATLWHIDPVRGKYEKQEFKLSEEFDNFTHLDKSKPFREEFDLLDKTEAHIKFLITDKDQDLQEHLTSLDDSIRPDKFEESILQRASQIFQINTVKLTIKVPGDPERKAGETVMFELPQSGGDVAEDRSMELDDFLQGKYLITSIKHSIIEDDYTMTMEIIKDTYYSPIKSEDPIERYEDRY